MTISPGRPGQPEQAIGSYLAEIAARLTGPARARRDIVAELDAGLADAADAYRSAGLSQAEATRAAVAEFGHPDEVASGLRAELAAVQARRTALALMAAGPLIGALWACAALASHLGAPPWEWAALPAAARLATHLAAIVLLAVIGSTLLTVATTGRLARWLGHWLAARPAASAAIAAAGTVAIDVTALTLLAILAATTPGRLAALPATAAATASLARLTLAARAVRNCLSTAGLGFGPAGR